MEIEAILFDADGVLQRPGARRRERWAEALGPDRDVQEFQRELFSAEAPALVGRGSIAASMASILSRWQCRITVDEALGIWTMIEPDRRIIDAVQELARRGIPCHLASNQEPHRAAYMSGALGYATLFTREFYSCRLGVMKPDPAYFRAILAEIDVPAERVLFIDDNEPNVDAARSVGLHAAVFTIDAGVDGLHRLLEEFGVR
jgi:putative hydrolase of the HAD superfamily